ncbi:MAG: VWA domain-containing protein [Prevotella sp.]|nr:VWA domain-containing protein [Prevotella sp.]MBR1527573.1 VWA domain-containing protein [Prevotella sp.]MDY6229722.1 VWA domain-containing protein [Prevotella sp.]
MEFIDKGYFLLLLLLIPYIVWYVKKGRHTMPSLRFSNTSTYNKLPKTIRQRLVWLPDLLRVIAFVAMVCILARPQSHNTWGKRTTEGIDIMLAMDVSTSMLAKDLSPNRIEAAKNVATEFISGRPDDNIGLTIFAGESFTQCPMTTDHQTLINMLQNVRTDIAARGLIEDGTAVGMGLANAVGRLEKSKTKSKIVILLTDGSNNRGDISPITAADIAKSLGIRVYTIGVGTNDIAYYPMTVGGIVQDVKVPVEIDEETLKKIAETTDGHYYRATNTKELKQIYKDIDKLEKTKLEAKKYRKFYDAYLPFAIVAFCMLLLELILRTTVLKREP